MTTLTGAHIVLESLLAEGTSVMFGYPGGTVIPFFDAFSDYKTLHHVLVRHEQGAAFAADGYARASGKVGVCLATSGPGATNLVTGIADAYMDSIPMVAITGQVRGDMIGSDAFQEVDILGITLPITKHNYFVEDARDIPQVMKEAFYIAKNGRPGPVHIDIPTNVFKQQVDSFNYSEKINLPGFKIPAGTDDKTVTEVVNLIKNSQKPVIICGHGAIISRAEKELRELAVRSHIPVVHTILGKGAFPESHELSYGMLGMHGMAYANFAVHNADLVIGIGTRFDDRITGSLDTFAKNAKIIHIDIDPAEIGKNVKPYLPVVGNIKDVLKQILEVLPEKKHHDWVGEIEGWTRTYPLSTKDTHRITVPKMLTELHKITEGKSIIVTDVGQHQMWTAQYYPQDESNKFLTSGGLGSMGFGLPAAIGARFARPNEEIWLINGDGGIQMNIQELMTIVQEGLEIKIAIMNNGFLGMVRQWQELFYDKNYEGTPITSPDFSLIAQAYGLNHLRCEKPSDIASTIKAARDMKGTVICEFLVEPEDNVFPMVAPGKGLKDTLIGK
ncbi:MAG: hypothetical protein ACD_51C00240G0006 [uncultured bacterium]|nr:MAG: hypothetical protein ACD_51C00240G0006 [uncultured bacterium]OGJ47719.1 MAG: acetolactate synthase, large subunit, biosynthetic type [Candidatus Peregrinibacteria bacterium RIFOXYA2_FULL_41_18]OGJ49240.1 MAG: acetolactate synthase, large subunit, biosynthetic type [Candidatus Peregrinibacteria bacterium RIFOXYB12_FULL_41_12]OGJ52479.1 MAG: acetolactate synthase, large subunit, biosynthetic type [Candidatus Peregrinibacteria bacterium RIFOXYC2_FULL_41_22]OGJ53062.1 MAG: acetolactate synt